MKPCNKDTENCSNTPGSYQCKCKKGWVRNKTSGACTKKKKKEPKKEGKEHSFKYKNFKIIYKRILKYISRNYRKITAEHVIIEPMLHVVYFVLLAAWYKCGLVRIYTVAALVMAYGVCMSYLKSVNR